MTLHGAGMITGALLAMMGALWYVLRRSCRSTSAGCSSATRSILVGAVLAASSRRCSAASRPDGRSSRRCRSTRRGSGRPWSETRLPRRTAARRCRVLRLLHRRARADDGHVRRAAARARLCVPARPRPEAPPPQAIAATVVALDGPARVRGRHDDPRSRCSAAPIDSRSRLRRAGREEPRLLLRPLDREPDHLPGAGAVYVLAARATPDGPYEDDQGVRRRLDRSRSSSSPPPTRTTSTWTSSSRRGRRSSRASPRSAPLLPVAVVTIYSMTMLVWGSRYRWTLASTLLYVGFAGWAIGGTGAVIDSLIPINFRFHNTLWVVGPLPHLPDPGRDRLGARPLRAPARGERRSDRAGRRLGLRGGCSARRRLRLRRGLVRLRRPRRAPALRRAPGGHRRLQPRGQHLRDRLRGRLPRAPARVRAARPHRERAPASSSSRGPTSRSRPGRSLRRCSRAGTSSVPSSPRPSSSSDPSRRRSPTRPRMPRATTISSTRRSSWSARSSELPSPRCPPSSRGCAPGPGSASRA